MPPSHDAVIPGLGRQEARAMPGTDRFVTLALIFEGFS